MSQFWSWTVSLKSWSCLSLGHYGLVLQAVVFSLPDTRTRKPASYR